MWLPEANIGPGSTWQAAKLYTTPNKIYAKKMKWGREKDLKFEGISFSRKRHEILSSKKPK